MSDNQLLVPCTSKEEFARQANQAAGINQQLDRPMVIRFNAAVGLWSRELPIIDPDTGFNKWEELGDHVSFQIITTRKQYGKNFSSEYSLYSKEFTGSTIRIINKEGDLLFEGNSKELKKDPISKEVAYNENVYVYAKLGGDDNVHVYKVKLSGSNLVTWFKYMSSFGGADSPTLYVTMAKKGKRMKYLGGKDGSVPASLDESAEYDKNNAEGRGDKNRLKLYYEIEFTKGSEYTDFKLVAERINAVNKYFAVKDTVAVIKETFGGREITQDAAEIIPTASEAVATEPVTAPVEGVVINEPPF